MLRRLKKEGGAPNVMPAPWPAVPPTMKNVLQPIQATVMEDTIEETPGATSSFQIAIQGVMDMSATDYEGFEVLEDTKEEKEEG